MSIKGSFLNIMLQLALTSRGCSQIILPTGEAIRGAIHLLLFAPAGSTKSAILHTKLAVPMKVPVFSTLTKAHILGSGDKQTGLLIDPAIWTCRKNMFLLDEFGYNSRSNSDKEMMDVLLQVTEYMRIHKNVGYRLNDVVKSTRKDKPLFLKVHNNMIECETCFSMVAVTMEHPSSFKDNKMKAFFTRTIIIDMSMNKQQKINVLKGKQEKIFLDYKKVSKTTEKLDYDSWNKIIDFVEQNTFSNYEQIIRLAGDIARVYVHSGRIWDEDLFRKIVRCKL